MDGKQIHWRVRGIAGVLFLNLLLFVGVLNDLQYVHGAEYLERSGRLRKGACRNPYRAGHVAGECPCRMRSGSFDPTNPSSGRFVCRVEPRP